jgi:hypothetical protein
MALRGLRLSGVARRAIHHLVFGFDGFFGADEAQQLVGEVPFLFVPVAAIGQADALAQQGRVRRTSSSLRWSSPRPRASRLSRSKETAIAMSGGREV